MPQLRVHPLDPAAVMQLQSVRGYPCVSLLLPTTPGDRLTEDDRAMLETLAAEAATRLRQEPTEHLEQTLARLDAALAELADRPVRDGLAVFVNRDVSDVVDLPILVRARCVVDPTFATRDLVRALHRTPRHLLLVLAADEAKLFDAALGHLTPVRTAGFPLASDGGSSAETFLRTVDTSLGTYARLRPAPLVVAAADPTLSTFLGLSNNLRRLAGTIHVNHPEAPLSELSRRCAPLLEEYLRGREREALALVEERAGQRRAVLGIDDCWRAAAWDRPEMLAVEEGFFYPARLDPQTEALEPAADPAEPGVIDDAVDELIEQVLSRGGWVALVSDGTIPNAARVAMTVYQ